MRRAAKRVVESGLRAFGLTRLARRRHRRDTIVLAYHNIVPTGEQVRGDSSLHLSQQAFGQQLDLLQATHTIIPLSELRTPTDGDRPRAVITFDDAYRGAVTAGVAELVKRRLPATIFVAPAFLGGGTFWWDVLSGSSGLDAQLRERALQTLQGNDDLVRAWAAEHHVSAQQVPLHETAASEAELRNAVASGLITLGSHTWSHPNLASLDAAELETQLRSPREWLESHFNATVPWISYPYGLHSPDVQIAAKRAGYEGGFLISGGWVDRAAEGDGFALPRLNIPAGVSIHGFALRVSGVITE